MIDDNFTTVKEVLEWETLLETSERSPQMQEPSALYQAVTSQKKSGMGCMDSRL